MPTLTGGYKCQILTWKKECKEQEEGECKPLRGTCTVAMTLTQRITNNFWEMASQFPENTSMAHNFMPQESYCQKQVQMVFPVLGFRARCIRSF